MKLISADIITFGIDGATIQDPNLQLSTPHKNLPWTTTHNRSTASTSSSRCCSKMLPVFRRTSCRRERSRRSSGTLRWPIIITTTIIVPLPSLVSSSISIISSPSPSAFRSRTASVRTKTQRFVRRNPIDTALAWCNLSRNRKISMPLRCRSTTSSIQSLSKPTIKRNIIKIMMNYRQRISARWLEARSNSPTLPFPTDSKSSIIRI